MCLTGGAKRVNRTALEEERIKAEQQLRAEIMESPLVSHAPPDQSATSKFDLSELQSLTRKAPPSQYGFYYGRCRATLRQYAGVD